MDIDAVPSKRQFSEYADHIQLKWDTSILGNIWISGVFRFIRLVRYLNMMNQMDIFMNVLNYSLKYAIGNIRNYSDLSHCSHTLGLIILPYNPEDHIYDTLPEDHICHRVRRIWYMTHCGRPLDLIYHTLQWIIFIMCR